MAGYSVAAIPGRTQHGEPESLQFPGCRPVRISRGEIADYEGRIEYWSADTEIAMVCEPVSVYHELPPQRLVRLIDRIAQTRGSPIETFGASDLLVRDAHGRHLRILQADQTVYLRPRAARPWGPAIEVGSDQLPDVVLEVDNTTDVRRGKLGIYESWGFPEVWVEVPDMATPSRPAGLRPGLTVYLLGDEGFRTAPTSRAFPGWTAEEIHLALNEPELSGATTAALRRIGRALVPRRARGRMTIRFCTPSARRAGRRAAWMPRALPYCRCLRRGVCACRRCCPGGWRHLRTSPPKRWCGRRWNAGTRQTFCAC